MPLNLLHAMNGITCQCGKKHVFNAELCIGSGVINKVPEFVRKYSANHIFVLSDKNTFNAAGKTVCELLSTANITFDSYCYAEKTVEPDEKSVGSAVMHLSAKHDMIIAVGSGVINDIGKILSHLSGKPYMIVATAPSMDGYASASSSMTRDGLKISLPTKSADIIIGDIDILSRAPIHMMKSGLGDMLAKYVSICEWRISHLITGEYYCEEIAQLIRLAVKRCADNAQNLLNRDSVAVQAVFEGLVIGGVAMNYAGLSRPASGMEHYISHILDMRAVEFGTAADLHGIQCAIGTLIAIQLYEKLKSILPDRNKALNYVAQFDYNAWAESLRDFLGTGAQSMIVLEEKEKKYDRTFHAKRLEIILNNWENILKIASEELPSSCQLETLLDRINAPKTLYEIGIDEQILPMILKSTKDIRDKYVLSRLLWDLGVLDEMV